jgi:hypothetical protein
LGECSYRSDHSRCILFLGPYFSAIHLDPSRDFVSEVGYRNVTHCQRLHRIDISVILEQEQIDVRCFLLADSPSLPHREPALVRKPETRFFPTLFFSLYLRLRTKDLRLSRLPWPFLH